MRSSAGLRRRVRGFGQRPDTLHKLAARLQSAVPPPGPDLIQEAPGGPCDALLAPPGARLLSSTRDPPEASPPMAITWRAGRPGASTAQELWFTSGLPKQRSTGPLLLDLGVSRLPGGGGQSFQGQDSWSYYRRFYPNTRIVKVEGRGCFAAKDRATCPVVPPDTGIKVTLTYVTPDPVPTSAHAILEARASWEQGLPKASHSPYWEEHLAKSAR